jgi:hypothetical protein
MNGQGLNDITIGRLLEGFANNGMGICILGIPQGAFAGMIPGLLSSQALSTSQVQIPITQTAHTPDDNDTQPMPISDAHDIDPDATTDCSDNEKNDPSYNESISATPSEDSNNIPIIRKHNRTHTRNLRSRVVVIANNTTVSKRNNVPPMRPTKPHKCSELKKKIKKRRWSDEEISKLKTYTGNFTMKPSRVLVKNIAAILRTRTKGAVRVKIERMMHKRSRKRAIAASQAIGSGDYTSGEV